MTAATTTSVSSATKQGDGCPRTHPLLHGPQDGGLTTPTAATQRHVAPHGVPCRSSVSSVLSDWAVEHVDTRHRMLPEINMAKPLTTRSLRRLPQNHVDDRQHGGRSGPESASGRAATSVAVSGGAAVSYGEYLSTRKTHCDWHKNCLFPKAEGANQSSLGLQGGTENSTRQCGQEF